ILKLSTKHGSSLELKVVPAESPMQLEQPQENFLALLGSTGEIFVLTVSFNSQSRHPGRTGAIQEPTGSYVREHHQRDSPEVVEPAKLECTKRAAHRSLDSEGLQE
ncbi:hypothetical protein FOZ62_013230, partial [Perkinsus olseni]